MGELDPQSRSTTAGARRAATSLFSKQGLADDEYLTKSIIVIYILDGKEEPKLASLASSWARSRV